MLHILHERMIKHFERELPPEQARFCRERGTGDQIADINQIIDDVTSITKSLFHIY